MKNEIKSALTILSFLTTLAACQQSPESVTAAVAGEQKPPTASEEKFVTEEAPFNKGLQAEMRMQRTPDTANAYQIMISVPEFRRLKVVRTDLKTLQSRVLAEIDSGSQATVYKFDETADSKDLSVREFQYELFEDGQTNISQVYRIKPDLIISGVIFASQRLPLSQYSLARLVLENKAILYIEDRNLHLEVEELISDNGRVLSFDPNKNSENTLDSLNGKNAGKLTLAAFSAKGVLDVQLRGADGMAGEKGLDNSQKGKKGATGATAEYTYIENCPPTILRTVDVDILRFGGCNTEKYCTKAAQPGRQGDKGPVGGTGFSGGNAGDGGDFKIALTTSANFNLTYDMKPGTPGKGGRGGNGGPGGDGGDPGKGAANCSASRTVGPIGPSGDPGAFGIDGREAQEGKVCLQMGSDQQFQCVQ